eukprot:74854_1
MILESTTDCDYLVMPHCDDISVSSEIQENVNTASFLMKSVPQIIAYKSQYLLTGYLSHRHLKISSNSLIPETITKLCYDYFVGDFIAQIQENIFYITKTTKDAVVARLFGAICPGPNNANFISRLLDVFHEINSSTHYSHLRFIYLSVALLFTKSPTSIALLNEPEIDTKVIYICGRHDSDITTQRYTVKILISLFNENMNYCSLFQQISNYSLWSLLLQNSKNVKVPLSKPLCRHLFCQIMGYSGDIKSDTNVFEFLAGCSANNEMFYFLNKEIFFIFNEMQNNNDLQIDRNILFCINKIFANEMVGIIDKKSLLQLYEIMAKIYLKTGVSQSSFNTVSTVISYSMENGLNESGWKLLGCLVNELGKVEIEYIFIDKCILFIENKTKLFKKNMISILDTLKEKCDDESQTQLKLATEICWKINKLIQIGTINKESLKHFDEFYKKVTKTKLIKPILRSLETQN